MHRFRAMVSIVFEQPVKVGQGDNVRAPSDSGFMQSPVIMYKLQIGIIAAMV